MDHKETFQVVNSSEYQAVWRKRNLSVAHYAALNSASDLCAFRRAHTIYDYIGWNMRIDMDALKRFVDVNASEMNGLDHDAGMQEYTVRRFGMTIAKDLLGAVVDFIVSLREAMPS